MYLFIFMDVHTVVECPTSVGDDEYGGRGWQSKDTRGITSVVVLCWRMHDKRRGAGSVRRERGEVDIPCVSQDKDSGEVEAKGNHTVIQGTAMEERGSTQGEDKERYVWVGKAKHTQSVI